MMMTMKMMLMMAKMSSLIFVKYKAQNNSETCIHMTMRVMMMMMMMMMMIMMMMIMMMTMTTIKVIIKVPTWQFMAAIVDVDLVDAVLLGNVGDLLAVADCAGGERDVLIGW